MLHFLLQLPPCDNGHARSSRSYRRLLRQQAFSSSRLEMHS